MYAIHAFIPGGVNTKVLIRWGPGAVLTRSMKGKDRHCNGRVYEQLGMCGEAQPLTKDS